METQDDRTSKEVPIREFFHSVFFSISFPFLSLSFPVLQIFSFLFFYSLLFSLMALSCLLMSLCIIYLYLFSSASSTLSPANAQGLFSLLSFSSLLFSSLLFSS